jgi:uncharacterized protein (TIGR02117 family)
VKLAWLAVSCLLGSACASAPPAHDLASGDESRSIFVIRRSLHTGIALETRELSGTRLTTLEDASTARYLEFGWGDAAYYQAERTTMWAVLASVVTPSESVMSVLPLTQISRESTGDYEAVELRVSRDELRAVVSSIESAFANEAPTPTGRTRRTSAGELEFYAANGAFHLLRTCNRWTTDRLRLAGCTLLPWPVLTPGRAMREARRCAESRSGR